MNNVRRQVLPALLLLGAGASIVACQDPANDAPDGVQIQGVIDAARGTQARDTGFTTAAGATSVTATVWTGESWAPAGAAPVTQGSYDLAVAVEPIDFVRIDATDDEGTVLGSVLVEPSAGDRIATPLSVETTVELALFEALEGDADIWPGIRASIDADTAVEVATGGDPTGDLQVLAHAVASSRAAQIQAWRLAGMDTERIDVARFAAATALSANLASDTDPYPLFFDALVRAETAAGATPDDLIVARGASSLAFRAMLEAHDAPALLQTTADTTARREAQVWAATAPGLLDGLGASAPFVDQALSLTDDLETDLREAADRTEVERAVDTWHESLLGSSTRLGLVGSVLGFDDVDRDIFLHALVHSRATAADFGDAVLFDAEGSSEHGDEAFGTAVTDRLVQERTQLSDELHAAFDDDPSLLASVDLLIDTHSTFIAL